MTRQERYNEVNELLKKELGHTLKQLDKDYQNKNISDKSFLEICDLVVKYIPVAKKLERCNTIKYQWDIGDDK